MDKLFRAPILPESETKIEGPGGGIYRISITVDLTLTTPNKSNPTPALLNLISVPRSATYDRRIKVAGAHPFRVPVSVWLSGVCVFVDRKVVSGSDGLI